jgi:hypothetical protein
VAATASRTPPRSHRAWPRPSVAHRGRCVGVPHQLLGTQRSAAPSCRTSAGAVDRRGEHASAHVIALNARLSVVADGLPVVLRDDQPERGFASVAASRGSPRLCCASARRSLVTCRAPAAQ